MQASSASLTVRIAIGSLFVGLLVLGLKSYAAYATGSIALFSDALESIVNVVTSVVALIAVRLAQRPADANLPYGYHKVEYFSAVVIGVFIGVTAILILQKAWYGFLDPQPFVADPIGLTVSILASAVNAGWAWVLIRTGRREQSLSLEADGKHLATDVVSTMGVLAGVLLAVVTGYHQLDAILAAFVALAILWSGWQLIRQSVVGLMDAAVEPHTLNTIREVIAGNADGAIEAHDIRTRQAGKATFIDFHLVVPGAMSVEAAHAICDVIEAKLREVVPHAQITIHVEPENKAKHSGIVVV
jgi:cation diffusion facilitator family transporter